MLKVSNTRFAAQTSQLALCTQLAGGGRGWGVGGGGWGRVKGVSGATVQGLRCIAQTKVKN